LGKTISSVCLTDISTERAVMQNSLVCNFKPEVAKLMISGDEKEELVGLSLLHFLLKGKSFNDWKPNVSSESLGFRKHSHCLKNYYDSEDDSEVCYVRLWHTVLSVCLSYVTFCIVYCETVLHLLHIQGGPLRPQRQSHIGGPIVQP